MSFFSDAFDIFSGKALYEGMNDYASGPKDAAKLQQDAANKATEAQLEMFHQVRSDQAPYRQIGYNSLNALAAMMGLPGYYGSTGDSDDSDLIFGQSDGNAVYERPVGPVYVGGGDNGYFSDLADRLWGPSGNSGGGNNYLFGFEDQPAGVTTTGGYPTGGYNASSVSPDYQFRFQQGQNALNRMLASNGMRLSGAAVKQAQRFGQGMASQEYQNRFNRLAQLAGIGQGANNVVTQANQNTSNAIAQNYLGAGNAGAAGIIGQNNNMANLAGTAGTIALAFI